MKKIMIASYFAGVKEQFCQIITEGKLESKNVLFISTAGNVEEYTGYIDEAMELFDQLGFKRTMLDISLEQKETCIEEIIKAEIIYVSGGNTFFLLQELKKKELVSVLQDKINQGCFYIGESAGGMILTKDITYCRWMDSVSSAPELEEFSALNVIDFYPVPHYEEEHFIESGNKIVQQYRHQLNLRPINNHQLIIVDDEIEIMR